MLTCGTSLLDHGLATMNWLNLMLCLSCLQKGIIVDYAWMTRTHTWLPSNNKYKHGPWLCHGLCVTVTLTQHTITLALLYYVIKSYIIPTIVLPSHQTLNNNERTIERNSAGLTQLSISAWRLNGLCMVMNLLLMMTTKTESSKVCVPNATVML